MLKKDEDVFHLKTIDSFPSFVFSGLYFGSPFEKIVCSSRGIIYVFDSNSFGEKAKFKSHDIRVNQMIKWNDGSDRSYKERVFLTCHTTVPTVSMYKLKNEPPYIEFQKNLLDKHIAHGTRLLQLTKDYVAVFSERKKIIILSINSKNRVIRVLKNQSSRYTWWVRPVLSKVNPDCFYYNLRECIFLVNYKKDKIVQLYQADNYSTDLCGDFHGLGTYLNHKNEEILVGGTNRTLLQFFHTQPKPSNTYFKPNLKEKRIKPFRTFVTPKTFGMKIISSKREHYCFIGTTGGGMNMLDFSSNVEEEGKKLKRYSFTTTTNSAMFHIEFISNTKNSVRIMIGSRKKLMIVEIRNKVVFSGKSEDEKDLIERIHFLRDSKDSFFFLDDENDSKRFKLCTIDLDIFDNKFKNIFKILFL